MSPVTFPRRERGSAAIEFAVVFIAVWAVVLLCWVAGRIALERNLIKDAARNAAMLVADATTSELASSSAVSALEDRVEATLTEAIEGAGNEVDTVRIRRRNSISGYDPALRTVVVEVDALYTEQIFPDTLPFGQYSVSVTVEVPYGSRLAGP